MKENRNRHFYFIMVVVGLLPFSWLAGSSFQAVFQNDFLLNTLLSTTPYLIFIKAGYWVFNAAVCVTIYSFFIIKHSGKDRLLYKRQNEMAALLTATRSVLKHKSFTDIARQIYNSCKSITGVTEGYVSLLSPNGTENEYLFFDSGYYSPKEGPGFSAHVKGAAAEVYKSCKTIYRNDLIKRNRSEECSEGQIGINNFLISPLMINDTVVGLLTLVNKEEGFNDEDSSLAAVFGEIISIALYNSKTLELFEESEKQKIETIYELNDAISKIRTLSGLVPICSACKKIRDDQGFWYQVEEYIENHSFAEFSHGLCPECIKKMHPEMYNDVFLNDKSG